MAYQNVVGNKLAQAEMPTTYFTVYTVPPNTRTYVKDIDICNTTAGSLRFYVNLVPSGKTAGSCQWPFLQRTDQREYDSSVDRFSDIDGRGHHTS